MGSDKTSTYLMAPSMRQRLKFLGMLLLFAWGIPLVVGCTAWPWQAKKQTSLAIPTMRIAEIREIGSAAYQQDPAVQQSACEELAMRIRTEPDPLVRQAIQESIAEFFTPLATQVLLAGLNDEHQEVRLTCCRKLGVRAESSTVDALQSVVETGKTLDDRLAAIDALGNIKTDRSVSALTVALKDRDPAMQYAGVNAMRNASGKNFDNDVNVWLAYAESGQLPPPRNVTIAEKMKSWMRY